MSLAAIVIPPQSEEEFFLWANAHAAHHYDCIRVAGLAHLHQFSEYILDPFNPKDMEEWLNNHQLMHLEMGSILNVATYELSELDWENPSSVESWFAQNFIEHQAWGTVLNLG